NITANKRITIINLQRTLLFKFKTLIKHLYGKSTFINPLKKTGPQPIADGKRTTYHTFRCFLAICVHLRSFADSFLPESEKNAQTTAQHRAGRGWPPDGPGTKMPACRQSPDLAVYYQIMSGKLGVRCPAACLRRGQSRGSGWRS